MDFDLQNGVRHTPEGIIVRRRMTEWGVVGDCAVVDYWYPMFSVCRCVYLVWHVCYWHPWVESIIYMNRDLATVINTKCGLCARLLIIRGVHLWWEQIKSRSILHMSSCSLLKQQPHNHCSGKFKLWWEYIFWRKCVVFPFSHCFCFSSRTLII